MLETMNTGLIQDKSRMLRARAELYRGLAQVGAADLRAGRLALADYFERLALRAEATTDAPAGTPHPAPPRH